MSDSSIPVSDTLAADFKDYKMVFADGPSHCFNSNEIVKTNFYATDSDRAGSGKYVNQVVLQLVLPVSAFLSTFAMYENTIKIMLANGVIDQAMIDKARSMTTVLR